MITFVGIKWVGGSGTEKGLYDVTFFTSKDQGEETIRVNYLTGQLIIAAHRDGRKVSRDKICEALGIE